MKIFSFILFISLISKSFGTGVDEQSQVLKITKESLKNFSELPNVGTPPKNDLCYAKKEEKFKGNSTCRSLSFIKAQNCKELTQEDRNKLLRLSDPRNFPHARYSSPPTSRKIEDSLDCSHFVHEIYKRIGLEFPYTTSNLLSCLGNFRTITKSEAAIGDLVVFKGHVGILDHNGKIVSATKGGKTRRAMLRRDDPNFMSSVSKDSIQTFGKPTYLKWSCK